MLEKYEDRLLEDLKEGPVYFYDKRAVGRSIDLLNKLVEKGLITLEIIDLDSQSSCLKASLNEQGRI